MPARPAETMRRWAMLGAVLVGFSITVLDPTVVSVALPSIHDDLGLSAPAVTWVVNAYLIPYGSSC